MSNLADRLRMYRIRETKLKHKINLFDKSADRIDELELIAAELEATHVWLDGHDATRNKDGKDYTIVGRLMLIAGRGKKMLDGLESKLESNEVTINSQGSIIRTLKDEVVE